MPGHAFRFYRLRLFCTTVGGDSVHFPAGKAANVVRGALGSTLRSVSCVPECPGARECALRSTCGYARIFEPVRDEGPSGMHDPPRPFVLRASHLDGKTIAAGGLFSFDLHLFMTVHAPVAALVQAFSLLADTGLGPTRGRVRLTDVDLLGVDDQTRMRHSIFAGGRFVAKDLPDPLEIDLAASGNETACEVEFVTPTELKHEGRVIAGSPAFAVLLARVRDRLGSLAQLYGSEPLDLDWTGLAERAKRVQLVRWEGVRQNEAVQRFSTKSGQTHALGGMTGIAGYRGDLGEFLPLLRAAEFTGVGRQTVWGKGWIRIRRPGVA